MIITDAADYRASAAVSFSKLKVFDSCAYLYWKKYVAKTVEQDEDTKAMRLGSAAHTLILEGSAAFAERYVVKPETYDSGDGEAPWAPNAKICKAWVKNQEALGRTVLTRDEASLLFRMRDSVDSNPDAAKLLAAGNPELAIRRSFPSLGIELQGRLDWITWNGSVVVDLKTIENLDDLPREIERRGYYRQLALYKHLADEEAGVADFRCAIIGVEKAEPRRCGVFWLRPDLLEIGDAQNMASLVRLAEAMRTGDWGGNPATREVGPSVELQLAASAAVEV
jgi:hypothetical protein